MSRRNKIVHIELRYNKDRKVCFLIMVVHGRSYPIVCEITYKQVCRVIERMSVYAQIERYYYGTEYAKEPFHKLTMLFVNR